MLGSFGCSFAELALITRCPAVWSDRNLESDYSAGPQISHAVLVTTLILCPLRGPCPQSGDPIITPVGCFILYVCPMFSEQADQPMSTVRYHVTV